MKIQGRAHLLGDFLNTDMHFTNKYKYEGKGVEFLAQHVLEDIDPHYPNRIQSGDILVGGTNFGATSTREQAVKVMRRLAIGAVLAKSFSRLFYRNALNNGLPAFQCDTSDIKNGDSVEIDTASGEIVVAEGRQIIQVRPLPPLLQALVSSGELLSFVKAHPDWR
ncbi:MAG: 3-isopropylmalate dehydratase [Candidatus Binatia bacterium]